MNRGVLNRRDHCTCITGTNEQALIPCPDVNCDFNQMLLTCLKFAEDNSTWYTVKPPLRITCIQRPPAYHKDHILVAPRGILSRLLNLHIKTTCV